MEELEALRQKLRAYKTAMITAIAIGFALSIFTMGISFFIAIIITIVISIISKKSNERFRSIYKEKYVNELLQEYFTDVYFQPSKGISTEFIKETGLIKIGRYSSSQDFISAKYNGISFSQSDFITWDVTTDSDGNETKTEYFNGRWLVFEFNKKFSCDLTVCAKGFRYARGLKVGLFGKDKGLMLENEVFNKSFYVNSDDPHQAFYILTPHMMERMLEAKSRTQGNVLFGFRDSKLHIAVNGARDSFEPSLKKPITMESAKKEIENDIFLITAFIDMLRLEDKNYYI